VLSVTFLKEFRVLTPPHSSKGQKEEEEEDKGRDSLVPSYIYEALKEKKRFDSMRVRTVNTSINCKYDSHFWHLI
jgi:ubiquitin carboxyl-terminal hydrolase 10